MRLAYWKMRNLDEKPYSPEEAEAAKYPADLTGIGGGDHPVGFLITSHRELVRQRSVLRAKYPAIFDGIACDWGRLVQRKLQPPRANPALGIEGFPSSRTPKIRTVVARMSKKMIRPQSILYDRCKIIGSIVSL